MPHVTIPCWERVHIPSCPSHFLSPWSFWVLPRWDMLVPWRVWLLPLPSSTNCEGFTVTKLPSGHCISEAWPLSAVRLSSCSWKFFKNEFLHRIRELFAGQTNLFGCQVQIIICLILFCAVLQCLILHSCFLQLLFLSALDSKFQHDAYIARQNLKGTTALQKLSAIRKPSLISAAPPVAMVTGDKTFASRRQIGECYG